MPIVLARVDDRLIHGQVTVGWGMKFHPDLVVVVSDEIANAEWESDLCLAALPHKVTGMVVRTRDAARVLTTMANDPRRIFVLFESPKDAFTVIEAGAPIETLNIGGMHSVKGKREVLDYIYLDEADARDLKNIRNLGISLDFRDVPERDGVDVMSRL